MARNGGDFRAFGKSRDRLRGPPTLQPLRARPCRKRPSHGIWLSRVTAKPSARRRLLIRWSPHFPTSAPNPGSANQREQNIHLSIRHISPMLRVLCAPSQVALFSWSTIRLLCKFPTLRHSTISICKNVQAAISPCDGSTHQRFGHCVRTLGRQNQEVPDLQMEPRHPGGAA